MPRPRGKKKENPSKQTNKSRQSAASTALGRTQQFAGDPLPTQTELPEREDDESSMDENEPGRSTVPAVFRAKAKVCHSHIWLPENGIELEEEGRVRWKCMRCRDSKSAKTFAVSTTKNAIDQLKSKHIIGYGSSLDQSHTQTIERAFSTRKPTITFNEDVCQQLLLRWIVKMNISFRVCEDESFRTYCSYLAACKPDYSAIHRAMHLWLH
jgi:hypothetical protein